VAIRFTCRVLVVRTESGKLRLKYGYICDPEAVRLITLTGPEMILPPDREFTAEELDRWEREIGCAGYTRSFQVTPADAPLVESKYTIEDEIPKGSVHWRLATFHLDNGESTFVVELTNTWNRQIPRVTLQFTWLNETPQTHPTAPPQMDIRELGGSDNFFRRMAPIGGNDMPPSFAIPFMYDTRALPTLLSRVAALSPERYCVEFLTEGHVFDSIAGAELSTVLDELDG
jgi:hypothetical protein